MKRTIELSHRGNYISRESREYNYYKFDKLTGEWKKKMNMSPSYEITTGTYKEDLLDFHIIQMITERQKVKLDTACYNIKAISDHNNIHEIVNHIRDNTSIKYPYSSHSELIIEFYDVPNCIIGVLMNFDTKQIKIDLFGEREIIEKHHQELINIFDVKTEEINMSWYYMGSRGMDFADVPVEPNLLPVYDCHYPFIEKGIDVYLEEYHKSTAPILLLAGIAGGGKSSIIRHYINKYKLNSMVTYDENIMMKDDFYINFLTSSKKHVLIVEDADILLSSREKDNNKIMSKFLNVSDGIVTARNKKIIFSTNITQLNKIDPAIIRKGRCFDVLEFRELTLAEANAVNKAHNMSLFETGNDFSLADVFNRGKKSAKVRGMGF